MDSPSPRSELARFDEDDESEHALASLWNWAHSIKPLHKVLSVLLVSLVLAALGFSSLPLWRPMGALVLHKLWDLLRFLVLTTSIGLGILNSRLWRGTCTEADSVALNSGKEDSVSYKVPFVGMFYGEVQHSYSFSDKEIEASEDVSMSRSESERDVGHGSNAASSTGRESAAALTDGQHASLKADNHHDKEDGVVNEEASVSPSIHVRRNAVNVVSRGKNRLVKPYDDLGLAAVAQHPKQSSSKIIHRRGSSLEFPVAQEWGTSSLEKDAATNHQSAPQETLPSSEKATSSTAFNVAVHANKKETEPSGSIPTAHRAEHAAGIPASKHSRSQSAYNLNELPVQQRPRSKPSTSSQLSKRKNVSLSCDLDKEYTNGGMPAWLSSLPSPPEPPLIYCYDIVKSRVASADVADSKQDESSLRKAFSESLAPWRAVTNTVPVDIPTFTHKEATQSNKDLVTRTTKVSTMEKQMVSTPSSSAPMGSPSPGELNKKVDAFIAQFHQRMRLQRLESLERSKQRGL